MPSAPTDWTLRLMRLALTSVLVSLACLRILRPTFFLARMKSMPVLCLLFTLLVFLPILKTPSGYEPLPSLHSPGRVAARGE